jgi:hypothetical protein
MVVVKSSSFVTRSSNKPHHEATLFPIQRLTLQQGICEYLCTFVLTTVILGGLMIIGPLGVESFISKLFQSNVAIVETVVQPPPPTTSQHA